MMVRSELDSQLRPRGENVDQKVNESSNLYLLADSSPSPTGDNRFQHHPSQWKQTNDKETRQQLPQLIESHTTTSLIHQQHDEIELSLPVRIQTHPMIMACEKEKILPQPASSQSSSDEKILFSSTKTPVIKPKARWESTSLSAKLRRSTRIASQQELSDSVQETPMPESPLVSEPSRFAAEPKLSQRQQPATQISRIESSKQCHNTQHITLQRTLNDREKFLLFVKIVFRLMDNESNIDQMKKRVKAEIAECISKNRSNDPEYVPLSAAIERKLQPILHHQIWNNANRMLHCYVRNQQHQQEQKLQRSAGS